MFVIIRLAKNGSRLTKFFLHIVLRPLGCCAQGAPTPSTPRYASGLYVCVQCSVMC